MKKAKIDGKIVEVIDISELNSGSNLALGYNAVEYNGMVYPLRGKFDDRPGIYPMGNVISRIVEPSPEEAEEYSADNIIDFSNTKSMKEFIAKQNILREQERTILTNIDNIFCPAIRDTDAPEMRAMKQAVAAKGIDLDKYEARFGVNYNNDKRLFDKPSITLSKLKTLCSALDIKATLILEDKGSDVPNPMRTQVITDLTGSNQSEDSDDD